MAYSPRLHMRLLIRIIACIGIIGWSNPALAAPPLVTGIQGWYENGQVRVRWEAPADADDITAYRIYYSRASILQNGGEFEDFETVSAQQREFIMTNVPKGRALFLSVLAVNADQEESPYFAEEVKVDIPSADAESPSDAPTERVLRLLGAEAISSTSILLTFSSTPSIEEQNARAAFQVTDDAGAVLALTHFSIRGMQVVLDTATQELGKTYTAHVSPVVFGHNNRGERIALDEATATATFVAGEFTNAVVYEPLPQKDDVSSPGIDLTKSGTGALALLLASGGLMGLRGMGRKRSPRA